MEQRFDYVKLAPARVLDAGCGAGADLPLLRRRYPDAEIIGVDSAFRLAKAARDARTLAEKARALLGRASSRLACADVVRLPFATASFSAVWSNLALPWLPDPSGGLKELQRVLEPGGLLMFSSYGPDTLKELRNAFAAADRHRHVHDFADMHDLGDLLLACGFAAPVMDVDIVTLTYLSTEALAGELRRTGQVNTTTDRRRGLMGRDAWKRMVDAYDGLRREGRIPATVELVFGHAWKGVPARAPGVAPIRLHR
jgi:malonyl-CoA O-methyltransferase